jgi:two-component system, chemotaxis family, chemotaxis protein CheY
MTSATRSHKRVLSVGQCGFDSSSIERFLRSHFAVDVDHVSTAVDALDLASKTAYDLMLVNRVFDADGGSGLDLITHWKSQPATSAIPVMLVSNYESAQVDAVRRGAAPGFGKQQLSLPETVQRLQPWLG